MMWMEPTAMRHEADVYVWHYVSDSGRLLAYVEGGGWRYAARVGSTGRLIGTAESLTEAQRIAEVYAGQP